VETRASSRPVGKKKKKPQGPVKTPRSSMDRRAKGGRLTKKKEVNVKAIQTYEKRELLGDGQKVLERKTRGKEKTETKAQRKDEKEEHVAAEKNNCGEMQATGTKKKKKGPTWRGRTKKLKVMRICWGNLAGRRPLGKKRKGPPDKTRKNYGVSAR